MKNQLGNSIPSLNKVHGFRLNYQVFGKERLEFVSGTNFVCGWIYHKDPFSLLGKTRNQVIAQIGIEEWMKRVSKLHFVKTGEVLKEEKKKLELRPEQIDIIEECMASIAFGSDNVILDLHTSFGKSLVMSELAKRLDGRIVIMVNITPLIDQIAEHLDEIGLKYSILKAGYEDRFNSEERIQLVMSQTFYARMDKVKVYADYFIQDEVHREYSTDRTNALVNHLMPKARIGLTGTAMDQNGYALDNAEILLGSTIKNSEDKEYIVPLKYYVPKWSMNVNYDSVQMSGSDYSSVSLNDVLNEDDHIRLVLESMNQMDAKNKKTLVFCNSIEHCDIVTAKLKKDGYNADCTHSKMSASHNTQVMESFSRNAIIDEPQETLFEKASNGEPYMVKCLVSVSKLNVGFSVKDIELGVMLRPTKVRSLWIQTCGRLIRQVEGKEYAEMLDLSGCVAEHGFHSEAYNAPELGKKHELVLEKKRVSMPVVSLLCKSEPTEILLEDVKLKIAELKLASDNIESESDINRLNYLYEAADNVYDVIRIAGVIGNRFRNLKPMTEQTIEFITEPWELLIESNIAYQSRILKTLKTMTKNKIKESKKLAALHYSAEWICSVNAFYINPFREDYMVPVIEIDEDEIQF